jgi:major intracellular serine protease
MNAIDLRQLQTEGPRKLDLNLGGRPPAYVPGAYLLRLDLKSIPISEDTKKTPPNLPFGVNAHFQNELSVLRTKYGLKYFAPMFANGFLYRNPESVLGPSIHLVSLWNDSQISPRLQSLQTVGHGQPPSAAAARSELQYMLLKFADEAKGAAAAAYLKNRQRKAQCGIASLTKVPARYISLLGRQPDSANPRRKGGKNPIPNPQKVAQAWWRLAIGLDQNLFEQINDGSTFESATIAVLDTGCALEHPHLQPLGEVIQPPMNDDVQDSTGHGTHVCGILVAKEPDLESEVSLPQGIGPDCFTLNIYKVVEDAQVKNLTDPLDTEYIANTEPDLYLSALRKVFESPSVRTISISLCGTAPYTDDEDEPELEHKLFKKLLARKTAGKANGVITVAAAGNSNDNWGTDVRYPACFPEVISVGATDDYIEDGVRLIWDYSNVGETNAKAVGRKRRAVDIYAPGAQIRSTYVNWYINNSKQEVGHLAGAQLSGTSMATPMVAAFVALLRSRKNKPLSAAVVMKRIVDLEENSELDLYQLLSL